MALYWLTVLFLVELSILTLLTFTAVKTTRHAGWRLAIFLLYLSTLPIGYISYTDLLGRAKPTTLELFRNDAKEVKLHWSTVTRKADGTRSIIAIIQNKHTGEFQFIRMPYDEAGARKMKQATNLGQEQGKPANMRNPYNAWNDNKRPDPYVEAPPPPPDKDPTKQEIWRYKQEN